MQGIKVAYDSQGFQQRFGGVSRYYCEMIRRLPGDIKWELPFAQTHNEYLARPPYAKQRSRLSLATFLPCMPLALRIWLYKAYKAVALLSCGILPSEEVANFRHVRKMVDSGRFDLIHFTGPHWLGKEWRYALGRIPYVVTVPDLIPEVFGVLQDDIAERRDVLENAAHIIVVSEWTKRDLVRLYGIDPTKITVIYHGQDSVNMARPRAVPDVSPKRYVLYVGMREGYKNWRFFVRSVAPLLVRRDMTLVCTGSPLTSEEKAFIQTTGLSERVRCLSCDEEELGWLYANAHCFVYPSKYEGFGIPILEAFARGCPVVLSRCSCFPEIAADAALFFDEGNEAQLADRVESLFDESLRLRLAAQGRERCREFSWERCAELTAEVYRRIVRSENGRECSC